VAAPGAANGARPEPVRPRRRSAPLLLALLVVAASASAHAAAAPDPQRESPPPPTLAELARLVAEQRAVIEAQKAELAAQQERLAGQDVRLAELERKLEEASALALATSNEVAELEARPPEATVVAAVEARLAEMEKTVQRVPEMAVENIQGEFPRSFRIPGTDAALRIGGLVRMVYVDSLDPIGSDDRFVTSSIPIAGSEEAGKTSRVEFSVIPSRFNLDLRTPTGVGHMRAFLEADFAGNGDQLRLRHAFGQWHGWLLGQTWSTFSDPEAEPDGIDFEGLNAISLFRQPQIRWTHPVGVRRQISVALEEARPDLAGATGVNQIPDLVLRWRWDPETSPARAGLLGQGSHIQTALVFRQLRGELEAQGGGERSTLATEGYGINVSGVMRVPWTRESDRIRFAWNAGRGIGRYISDLNSAGGQDAVYDPATGELVPLDVAAAYFGFEHWWSDTLRSTITGGFVWVDNPDFEAPESLRRTERYSLNLAWSPIARLDLVAELLWGRRVNRDGRSGEAGQIQLGSTFRF
jgi:hypothetical protein